MFHVAGEEDIKAGRTTDVYFLNTVRVLREKGIRRQVVAEVSCSTMRYPWGVLAGVEEVARLLEGYRVDVDAMPEGSVFFPNEPVLRISGEYTEFAVLETPLLGMLCQASGIATKAARFRLAAGERLLLSFGIRRLHPAIAPMIDRSAYIGGCDGFSGVAAERLTGERARGTMPHALVIVVGEQSLAWRYFDEVMPEDVPRIALVDTYCDEKWEAVKAAESVSRLEAVRLDTPASRRGDLARIVEEVRWELDVRGYRDVKIFVSGGIEEEDVRRLRLVDGFGVGTSISSAPPIDFALDIVEVEGKPAAKRGKRSMAKSVLRCRRCMRSEVVPRGESRQCGCGGEMEDVLVPLIRDGRLVKELPSAGEIRRYVLEQLEMLRGGDGVENSAE
ncbi:MAG: nicotinate phosphoribosyltransferase [Euryarchaeota archaeon]|nr:nicotinate phosphoribosyltransferase [Euryarchaeota archaeon]